MAIEGARQTTDRLRRISQNVSNKIEEALTTSALIVERDAKINAPVNKIVGLGGRLRASITHKTKNFGSNNPSVTIGTNVEYAKYQEFGTGEAGKASNVPTLADYEYGSSKGIPAQPFLFPAYNNNKQRIIRELAKAFRKGCGL